MASRPPPSAADVAAAQGQYTDGETGNMWVVEERNTTIYADNQRKKKQYVLHYGPLGVVLGNNAERPRIQKNTLTITAIDHKRQAFPGTRCRYPLQ